MAFLLKLRPVKGRIHGQLYGYISSNCYYKPKTSQSFSTTPGLRQRRVASVKQEGLYKQAELASDNPPFITFVDCPKQLLNFSSYDYLNLANDNDIKLAYSRNLSEEGFSGSIRQTDGVKEWTLQLESILSGFHNRDACLSYATVAEALSGLFHSAFGENDVILSDEYNSIYQRGEANWLTYKHLDLHDLERKLLDSKSKSRKIVLSEGVFMQTGETSPLSDLLSITSQFGAELILNDSHGIGILGPTLRGTEEYHDLLGTTDNVLLTCDMGFGLGQIMGGYMTASSEVLLDHMTSMTSQDFSTVDLSAASSAAAAAVFYKLPTLAKEAERLRHLSLRLREALFDLNLKVKGHDHPVVSFQIGNEVQCQNFVRLLQDSGHLAEAIIHPIVNRDDAHVRLMLNCAHQEVHINTLVHNITEILSITEIKE